MTLPITATPSIPQPRGPAGPCVLVQTIASSVEQVMSCTIPGVASAGQINASRGRVPSKANSTSSLEPNSSESAKLSPSNVVSNQVTSTRSSPAESSPLQKKKKRKRKAQTRSTRWMDGDQKMRYITSWISHRGYPAITPSLSACSAGRRRRRHISTCTASTASTAICT